MRSSTHSRARGVPRRAAGRRARATLALTPCDEPFGPASNGILMTPEEFDAGDFEEGWTYELINGVLIVTPIPFEEEVDPNEELGHLLRSYREQHPQGAALDKTLAERYVRTKTGRRRPDRLIWAGLGRHPRRKEAPAIAVEFVSMRKRDRVRDYETKRDEYRALKIKEYCIIDRFMRTMTVFTWVQGRSRATVIREHEVYRTDLLPGFELPLARLFKLADEWAKESPE